MRSHHNAIHGPFAHEGENLVGGKTGTHNDLAGNALRPDLFREGLEMFDFGTGGSGVVVVADAGGLRRCHNHRVIGMKQNEICAELSGLSDGKAEGLFVGGDLGGEEDRGGFAPPWLQCGCHGNLPGLVLLSQAQLWFTVPGGTWSGDPDHLWRVD